MAERDTAVSRRPHLPAADAGPMHRQGQVPGALVRARRHWPAHCRFEVLARRREATDVPGQCLYCTGC